MQEENNIKDKDKGVAPANRKIPVWDSLSPQKKRIVSVTGISLIALTMMLFAYQSRQKNKEVRTAEKIKTRDINLDTGMIEETLQDVLLKREKEKDQELEYLKDKIKELSEKKPVIPDTVKMPLEPVKGRQASGEKDDMLYPPPPPSRKKVTMEDKIFHANGMKSPTLTYQSVEMVGGISSSPIAIEPEKKRRKTRKVQSIFLLLLWRRLCYPA